MASADLMDFDLGHKAGTPLTEQQPLPVLPFDAWHHQHDDGQALKVWHQHDDSRALEALDLLSSLDLTSFDPAPSPDLSRRFSLPPHDHEDPPSPGAEPQQWCVALGRSTRA